ncbi:MAG: hypothetical protein U0525_00275 [Patescibacteria group bacterium]
MDNTVIHQIDPVANIPERKDMARNQVPKNTITIVLLSVLVLGILTGGAVAGLTPKTTSSNKVEVIKNTDSKNAQSAGVLDKKTFTDSAEGVLKEGGFEGEGSHHLERGAKDQTAYLTSSTIDLTPFVGKKVKVWGQTHTSEKVGWFMDVGYIEIVK